MAKVVAMPVTRKKENEPQQILKEEVKSLEVKIKQEPFRQENYQRLMILYRKLRDPQKELKVIDSAIAAFKKLYSSNKIKDPKIATVSKKLNLAFGLIDKKGNQLHEQEPLATWHKRKQTVQKKLAAK